MFELDGDRARKGKSGEKRMVELESLKNRQIDEQTYGLSLGRDRGQMGARKLGQVDSIEATKTTPTTTTSGADVNEQN